MPRYDHAYSIGFSVISDQEDASDVTSSMLREALMRRIQQIDMSGGVETFLQACDAPWDTMEAGK